MSQSEKILALASAVGAKCKELNAHIGGLSSLTTTAKTSLVVALNEVNAALSALSGTVGTNGSDIAQLKLDVAAVEKAVEDLEGVVEAQTNIDDSKVGTTTTYSSSKVVSEINAAKQAVKDEILDGAGDAFDTLKELQDAIAANKGLIEAFEAVAAGHVKFDGAQSLTDDQKGVARSNIGAVAQADHEALAGRVGTAEGKVSSLEGKMATAEGKIAAVEGKVTTLEGEMDAVELLAGNNQTAIDGLTERMGAVETKATTNETNLGTLTGRVTAVEGKANDNAAAISALAEAVGDTTTDYVAAFNAALA